MPSNDDMYAALFR